MRCKLELRRLDYPRRPPQGRLAPASKPPPFFIDGELGVVHLHLERVREVRPSLHPYRRQGHPRGEGWLHELKLDGYRFQIIKGTRAVRLCGRSGYDWTKRLIDVQFTIRMASVANC